MSIRFDASGDGLSRTANLPTLTTLTISFWARNQVSTGVTGNLFHLFASSSGNGYAVYVNSSNLLAASAWDGGTTFRTDPRPTLSVGTWFFCAATFTDTGNAIYLYYAPFGSAITRYDMTSSFAVSGIVSKMTLGVEAATPSSIFNGNIAAVKIWTDVKTDAQIYAEQWSIVPVNFTNLHAWYPGFPGTSERIRDYGVNGYNWTADGTLTDEVGPPIIWGLRNPPITAILAAGGGTTYNQSISGEFIPAATLLNQGQKVLSGTFVPTASSIKQTQKMTMGTFTPTAILARQIQKMFTGSFISNGNVINQGQKKLTGSLSSFAGLANQTQKTLSGNITPIGILINQVQKILNGEITPNGILVGVKTALVNLTGLIIPTGNLTKETQKILSGFIIPTAIMVKLTDKILTGNVTPSGVLGTIKAALVNLVGSLTPTGTLNRQTQKILIGIIPISGIITKQNFKILTGIINPSGGLISLLGGISNLIQDTFKNMFKGMFRRMK